MSYIQEFMNRANLQQLREFLITGVENMEEQSFNFDERLNNAHGSFAILAKEHGINKESELYDEVLSLISECEKVFIEVGIISGFMLCKDIFEKGNELEKI